MGLFLQTAILPGASLKDAQAAPTGPLGNLYEALYSDPDNIICTGFPRSFLAIVDEKRRCQRPGV